MTINFSAVYSLLAITDNFLLVSSPTETHFASQGKHSMLERLVKAGYPHVHLEAQYLMHPDISAIANQSIYHGMLKNSG
jgi:hypothetical protein